MTQEQLKMEVAIEAFNYVESVIERDTIIGVGTGSTANFFIKAVSYTHLTLPTKRIV